MTTKVSFGVTLTISLLAAFLSMEVPGRRMPLDYSAMIAVSTPLAVVWMIVFLFGVWRYGRRGLWLIAGAPLALWWPIWMMFDHFPPCYYSHNCI